MHIVLRHVGQIIVIYVAHLRNIQAPRRHIRRNKNHRLAFAKRLDRALALALGFVAMHRRRRIARLDKRLHKTVRTMFRARKHNCRLVAMPIKQLDQKRGLFGLGDKVNALRHLIRRLPRRRDLHSLGIIKIGAGDLGHLFGHGGRKQHGLTLFREPL